MLAVSSNVEAARADEYGRGFSVVVGDIRSLSNDSSEHADRIKDLVRQVQSQMVRVAGDIELAGKTSAAESSIELFDDFATPALTVADSPGEMVPPSEPSEVQPRPAELAASKTTTLVPAHPVAEKKLAASEDLGDNVELFR